MANEKAHRRAARHSKHKINTQILPFHLISQQSRWFFLLHALVTMIILYPYFEEPGQATKPFILNILDSTIVMLLIYTVSFNKRQLAFSLLLGTPALLFYWLPYLPSTHIIGLVSKTSLYAYAILMTLPYLVHAKSMDSSDICGVATAYILLGFAWAGVFQIINIAYPHSFYISDAHNLDAVMNWSDFLYFSFTTLTTLGYGDIAPITAASRSIAVLESITGVLFIAVMIGKVLGVHIAQTAVNELDQSGFIIHNEKDKFPLEKKKRNNDD